MKTLLLVLFITWCGCGRSVEPMVERGWDAGLPVDVEPEPGWYEVPQRATTFYGQVRAGVARGSVLQASFEFAPEAPAGKHHVSVVWQHTATEQPIGEGSLQVPIVRARLQPPAAALEASTCSGGRRARGVLFVRYDAERGGPLVAASAVQSVLNTATGDSFVEYDECAAEDRDLSALPLWREPRLALAHCVAMGRECQDVDGVRLWDATVHIEGDKVRLSSNAVFGDASAIRVEVNGRVLVPDAEGLLRRSDFLPGRNRVTWRLEQRPPLEAVVVLPRPLQLRVTEVLRTHQPFTISSEQSGWATAYLLNVRPLPTIPRGPSLFFEGSTLPFTGLFEGFATAPAVGRANVSVVVTRTTEHFAVSLGESAEVDVAP
jgi:hypothetical protein